MTKTINQDNLNASLRMLDKIGEANTAQIKLADAALGERMEKLGELLNNQSFLDQFIACPDSQAAHKLFGDHSLLLSLEEVEGLMLQIKTLARKLLDNDGELSEEDLEQVNGGLNMTVLGGGGVGAFIGSGIGLFAGSALGSAVPVIGTVIGGNIGMAIGAVIGAAIGGLIGWFID